MWYLLSKKYPDPYRRIKIETEDGTIVTKTYIHFGNLMIEFTDGNEFFHGMSLELFDQSKTKWCYIEDQGQ